MAQKKNGPGCCVCGSSGGGGCLGIIPNCFCTPIPPQLAMTSADPTCNYRMFQSCTISYGPHPGFESLNFGAKYYLSDQSFPDPVAGGAMFWYALLCQYNQFSLTRAYLESPYGSPFRDGILYTWLVGGYGNTCGGDGSGWKVNPAYLEWASCADDYLNANNPADPPWDFTDITVDPSTGCATGPSLTYDTGYTLDLLGSSCGDRPPLITSISGTDGLHLENGVAFPGSDASCRVTIDG